MIFILYHSENAIVFLRSVISDRDKYSETHWQSTINNSVILQYVSCTLLDLVNRDTYIVPLRRSVTNKGHCFVAVPQG